MGGLNSTFHSYRHLSKSKNIKRLGRIWKTIKEVFILQKANVLTKCKNVLHTSSLTLKWKTSEYCKSLCLLINSPRHLSSGCVFHPYQRSLDGVQKRLRCLVGHELFSNLQPLSQYRKSATFLRSTLLNSIRSDLHRYDPP